MSTYRKIELSELLPADIIVTTDKSSPISATIRSITGSSISHTMLYAGNQQVIEARQEGETKPFQFCNRNGNLGNCFAKTWNYNGAEK